MIDGVINYIRSWFATPLPSASPFSRNNTRKRRNPNNGVEHVLSPKLRKVLSTITINDEELVPFTTKRTSQKFNRVPVIVLDGEPSPKLFTQTSTPKMHRNSYDDIKVTNVIKSSAEKRKLAASKGFTYITRSKNNSSNSQAFENLAMDHSVRLDDYKRYHDLIKRFSGSNNSTINHLSSNQNELSDYDVCNQNNTQPPLIDLTSTKLSAKDKVMKVLDDFEKRENNVIDLNDSSESDVEILPTPPSPKPDIRVEPVNTLRKIIDTNHCTKKAWLSQLSDNHQQILQNKRSQIKQLVDSTNELNEINHDILINALNKKVRDSLLIKEAILPVIDLEEEEEETVLPELTDEQNLMVRRALGPGNPNEVLTPKFSLNVTRRDIQSLAGLNWLNDNVINFYMNLIMERGKLDRRPSAYAMNTFFYQRLVQSGPESLRRWTRRVDIFAHDIICIPIHLGVHWCMTIVNLKEKYIRYYDSMGSPNDKCLYNIQEYLQYEHMDKKKEMLDMSDFTLENVEEIPKQMNGSDCGMFACTFAEFATRKAKLTFSQQDMPYLRRKMVVEILTGHLLIE